MTSIRVALSLKRSEDGDPRREPEGGGGKKALGLVHFCTPMSCSIGGYEFGTVVLEIESNRPVGEVGGI